jgi:hypothetical protein
MANLLNTTITGTVLRLPNGTTAQRPSPQPGMIRYNTDSNNMEVYDGTSWFGSPIVTTSGSVNTFTLGGYNVIEFTGNGTLTVTQPGLVDILLVAGGGGAGGNDDAGGGGAGGVVFRKNFPVTPQSYSIVVGNGGAVETNGEDTTAFGLTAIGGGSGGRNTGPAPSSGGSGGGGWWDSVGAAALQPSSASGGYGNQGGEGDRATVSYEGAGGGGAGGPGVNSRTSFGGQAAPGGFGLYFGDYFGTSVGEDGWFASGGSGGGETSGTSLPGFRRKGGGALYNIDALPNTGGGGAAHWDNSVQQSQKTGGSGVVLIRYRN